MLGEALAATNHKSAVCFLTCSGLWDVSNAQTSFLATFLHVLLRLRLSSSWAREARRSQRGSETTDGIQKAFRESSVLGCFRTVELNCCSLKTIQIIWDSCSYSALILLLLLFWLKMSVLLSAPVIKLIMKLPLFPFLNLFFQMSLRDKERNLNWVFICSESARLMYRKTQKSDFFLPSRRH